MKKLTIIMAMMLIINIAYSQKVNYQSAVSSLNKGFLDKAKNYIDPCITDPSTKDWPKTWMARGDIYLKISESTDDKYKNLDSNAIEIAYDSYKKCIDLDTKKEYSEQMKLKLYECNSQFYNKAVKLYSAQKYSQAMECFDKTASITNLSGASDSLATYNAAICAEYAGKNDKAIEYYRRLIGINYLKPAIYSNLAGIYRNKYLDDNPYKKVDIGSDTTAVIKLIGRPNKVSKTIINNTKYDDWKYKNKLNLLFESGFGKVSYYNTDSVASDMKSFDEGIKVIQKGMSIFPGDNTIIIAEANLYLTAGKFIEAKDALEKLKEKDPTNPSVYYAIGNAYFDQYNNESNNLQSRLNAYEEAVKSLQKSIDLKADNFDAVYMLGAIYFNEGIRLEQESEKYINDLTQYNKMKEKFDVLYKQATDNLEKASNFKPDDYNTLVALRKLYSRLNMKDKYNAVNEKIKNMK